MAKEDDLVFRQMTDLYAHSVVRDFYHYVELVAGFKLPPSIKAHFER
jgi:hypothetical protein